MRRNRRIKSMARTVQAAGTLARRLWRATPWLLAGALLLALAVPGGAVIGREIDPWARWMALAGAVVAPLAALALDPPFRPRPGRPVTLAAYAGVLAAVAHFVDRLVLTRANSFYSSALLAEGTLILLALHAMQAVMRRVSPPPATAGPRAADSFIDGVRVLLMIFLLTTAVGLRPAAAVALLLSLGFAAIAVLLRTPGALSTFANRERA
jgi:hypothetical protein